MAIYKKAYLRLFRGIFDAVELIENSEITKEKDTMESVSIILKEAAKDAENIIIESDEVI